MTFPLNSVFPSKPMEHKSGINPAILQPMLESAANAAEKGQSQFFTPMALARTLATALPPRCRPAIVDLNCGAGHLLQASALPDTEWLLGNDIDPAHSKIEGLVHPRSISHLTCDLTRLYPLLKEINFQADLFVLNPPWRLWWYRERLAALANSKLPAVREAFANLEETAPRKDTVAGTIDSTIATLLIALDLCTRVGEGMLIANNATLERLIFGHGARGPSPPHAAIAKHIWAHLVIPGNPVGGNATGNWTDQDGPGFHTGVIYFAADHCVGPQKYRWSNPLNGPLPDRAFRLGTELWHRTSARQFLHDEWAAVKDQLAERDGQSPRTPFHLWLKAAGRIKCDLSRFEAKSVKLNKREAERLFRLQDKTPMELVLQRAQRDELLHVIHRGGWRVAPELVAAVTQAVADYHAARAPLYPLPAIQRLGYLDEQDTIACKTDLLGVPAMTEAETGASQAVIFHAGQKYSLRTQTVNVTRRSRKPNSFTGAMEELEHSGQQLAIYLSDGLVNPAAKENTLNEYCFMDATIKDDPNTKVAVAKKQKHNDADRVLIDFTLQQLAGHFVIPEVPDVAATNPDGYRQHLDTLAELERICEELTG